VNGRGSRGFIFLSPILKGVMGKGKNVEGGEYIMGYM